MSTVTFSTECPELQGFIKKIDTLDEEVNSAVWKTLPKCGYIIRDEQRRLANETNVDFLAPAITVGKVTVAASKTTQITHNGVSKPAIVSSITSGYHEEVFRYDSTPLRQYRSFTISKKGLIHDQDYWKHASTVRPGVIGLTYEFGRPGKSTAHHRNSPTMKQIRRRIPNKDAKRSEQKKAVPTEVDIRKGTIQPHSHIRRGFDGKKKESARIVISVVENEVRKLGE